MLFFSSLMLLWTASHFRGSVWYTLCFGAALMLVSNGLFMYVALHGGHILSLICRIPGRRFGTLHWLWFTFPATDCTCCWLKEKIPYFQECFPTHIWGLHQLRRSKIEWTVPPLATVAEFLLRAWVGVAFGTRFYFVHRQRNAKGNWWSIFCPNATQRNASPRKFEG